jgi:HEAT repeat protein
LRREVVDIFRGLGIEGKAGLPQLIRCLKDKDSEVRWQAADAIARIGPEAESAASALADALQDREDEVRSSAAYALSVIGPAAKTAVPALIQAMQDDSQYTRIRAAEALWQITGSAKDALPVLIDLLKKGEDPDAADAARLLGKFGPAAKEVVTILRQKTQSDSRALATAAATALWKITGDPEEALPRLIELIETGPNEAGLAIHAIEKMGPAARRAAPTLRAYLGRDLSTTTVHAAEALWRVTGSSKETLPILRKALADDPTRVPTHEEERNRERAFETIHELGPEAAPLLPQILKVHCHDKYLAALLGRMGPAAREAVPVLVAMLDDPFPGYEEAAAEALKRVDSVEAARRGIK